MTEAASLVTTGTTAVRALVDVAGLESGQRVLIRGGAFTASAAIPIVACSTNQQIRNAQTAMDEPGHRAKLVLTTT